jgi:hypothetical protein
MSSISDQDYLLYSPYKTAANLNARIRLHELYSTNKLLNSPACAAAEEQDHTPPVILNAVKDLRCSFCPYAEPP